MSRVRFQCVVLSIYGPGAGYYLPFSVLAPILSGYFANAHRGRKPLDPINRIGVKSLIVKF